MPTPPRPCTVCGSTDAFGLVRSAVLMSCSSPVRPVKSGLRIGTPPQIWRRPSGGAAGSATTGRASPVVPAGPVQAAQCRAVHAQPAGHGVDPVVQLLGPGAADRLGEPADERQQVRYPVDRAGYLFQPAQQGRYVAPIGRRRRLTRLDQVGHRLGDLRRRDDGQQAGERPGG